MPHCASNIPNSPFAATYVDPTFRIPHFCHRVPVPARDLMSPEAVQQMISEKGAMIFSFVDVDRPLRQVDIFLRAGLSFEELSSGAHVVSVEGRALKIIGMMKLLEIKRTILPLRDKDLIDIKELVRLQGSREKPQN
jgi:hypothetical protein